MFVCRSAITLPAVIDNAASIHSRGWNTSSRPKKPTTTRFIKATKPAALEATARKAVTGVGAPSYVSGAQVWNGKAETLKANPIMTNIINNLWCFGHGPFWRWHAGAKKICDFFFWSKSFLDCFFALKTWWCANGYTLNGAAFDFFYQK